MENYDTDFKGLDAAHISQSSISSAVHRIRQEDTITDSVVLGFPAFNVKGETSEGNVPKNVFMKNSKNTVKAATKSDLPVKIETMYFEDSEFSFYPEKNSYNKVNATAQSSLPINIVPKFFDDSDFCSSHEKNFNMVKSTAQSAVPVPIKIEQKSFEDSEFGFSHEKNLALLIKAKAEPPEETEASLVLGRYAEKLPNISQLRHINRHHDPIFCCRHLRLAAYRKIPPILDCDHPYCPNAASASSSNAIKYHSFHRSL
ncbi:hypothetical protein KSP40_PGU020913 [Platanthera guangdongensis]|uniref:Uncharacterized protein n=1 Tax=Platanthera guangdongensis TaxID=2320717 RepID=A0ABR2N5L6_9ASPA